ncbi:hypothetical protein PILCRDRAFT_502986 [Piloderma croceum F 1598]|uniref:Uncharacterized protein n=1 Tax=Piloderma croceum (strain F 1598) TaxID=765440 RepID=A0A0C3BV13_PILCF|nr:hypothetical protein PILCRDRAFT_502986 [Piloderma croceum F 1598]
MYVCKLPRCLPVGAGFLISGYVLGYLPSIVHLHLGRRRFFCQLLLGSDCKRNLEEGVMTVRKGDRFGRKR